MRAGRLVGAVDCLRGSTGRRAILMGLENEILGFAAMTILLVRVVWNCVDDRTDSRGERSRTSARGRRP